MAKLIAHGKELFRYLGKYGLCAVMNDGTTLAKTPSRPKWHVVLQRRKDVPLEQWRKNKLAWYRTLPEWRKVRSIPSLRELSRWSFDGVCETPSGHRVEPDGTGPDGSPSWLLIFGYL